MKPIKFIFSLVLIHYFGSNYAQTYTQPAEVISAGGGESIGGNYSNFGVIGQALATSSSVNPISNFSGFIYFLPDSPITQVTDYIPGGAGDTEIVLTNYPNPFSNATTIAFTISGDEDFYDVILNIYDLHGRLVNCLINGKLSGGSYEREWKCNINDGIKSGFFILMLGVKSATIRRVAEKKMVLIGH